jgi:urate oxidase
MKSTGSEFHGFHTDRYTTLRQADDRVLATSLQVRWHLGLTPLAEIESDWDERFTRVRERLLSRFAEVHSLALQQTLWEMGKAVLENEPVIDSVSLTAPNLHHFMVDLEPFGLENPGEVYFAADRPYGLIQANVIRDDVADPGLPWPDEPTD